MTRRLLNLLTALSLLMCVAVCALWVRSYWVRDSIGWLSYLSEHNARWMFVESKAGAAAVGATALTNLDPTDVLIFERSETPKRELRAADRAEWRENLMPQVLRNCYAMGARTVESTVLVLPYWPLAALTVIAPAVRAWRRLRRRRPGLCAGCGYDLRATPGRCPECGAGTPSEPPAL